MHPDAPKRIRLRWLRPVTSTCALGVDDCEGATQSNLKCGPTIVGSSMWRRLIRHCGFICSCDRLVRWLTSVPPFLAASADSQYRFFPDFNSVCWLFFRYVTAYMIHGIASFQRQMALRDIRCRLHNAIIIATNGSSIDNHMNH